MNAFLTRSCSNCTQAEEYLFVRKTARTHTFAALKQALTSTQGYSLPDFFNYYPYPTRKFLLPDKVEGSEEHPLCPIIDRS